MEKTTILGIMKVYGKSEITRKIRTQRARWLGHTLMPERRNVKRILHKFEETHFTLK